MASSLEYILQAAMGQCSTLPTTDGNNKEKESTHTDATAMSLSTANKYRQTSSKGSYYRDSETRQQAQQPQQQRDDVHNSYRRRRNEDGERQVRTDDNNMMTNGPETTANVNSFINVVRNSMNALDPFLSPNGAGGGGTEPMETTHTQPPPNGETTTTAYADDHAMRSAQQPHHSRQGSYHQQGSSSDKAEYGPFPLPPESAVKARCYRLNLEHPYLATMDLHNGVSVHGPMEYEPPPHHKPSSGRNNMAGDNNNNNNSSSRRRVHSWHSATAGMMALHMATSDGGESAASSTAGKDATAVAVSTAKIFRGITVDKNGTIISQNERASRSSSGRGRNGHAKKLGEKSRQAAKIDKAKDLVDEAVNNAGKDESEKSNMVSLVIMGEYDDMKHLVRDGSKKLRDAEGLPDEALLAINRPRISQEQLSMLHGVVSTHDSSPVSPSRKRLSPHEVNGSGGGNGSNNGSYSPMNKSRHRTPSSSSTFQVSPTPKHRGHHHHPHHTHARSNSRKDVSAANMNEDTGHHFLPVRDQCHNMPIFGVGGDGDWSDALGLSKGFHSIWNCGGTGTTGGTMSPTHNNTSSPASVFEERNESEQRSSSRAFSTAGVRVDPPGGTTATTTTAGTGYVAA